MVALATLLLAVSFVIFRSWIIHSSCCNHFFELFFFSGGVIEIKTRHEPLMLQKCFFAFLFLRSVPQHKPVSEVYRSFLGLHDVVRALTCAVNCRIYCRRVCAASNNTRWNWMDLSSILSVKADAVNVHVICCMCVDKMNFGLNQFWIKAFNRTTCGISEGLWLPSRCAVHTPHLISGYMSLNNLHLVVTIKQLLAQLCDTRLCRTRFSMRALFTWCWASFHFLGFGSQI